MALSDSIIAFWKLEESSGTRVDAASTNDLTDFNTVTQATGKVGNAAQFTLANTEFLAATDNIPLSMGDIDFSMSTWIYLDTKAAAISFMGKWKPTGFEYVLFYNVSTDRFQFHVSNDGSATDNIQADSFGAPPTATWMFVVCWHDSVANTINIQVDNGTIDSKAYTLGVFDGVGRFVLGADDNNADHLDGRMDASGLWKKTLSTNEKTSLWNGGGGLEYPFAIISGDTTKLYWPHHRKRALKTSHSKMTFLSLFLNPPADFRVESRTPTSAHLAWTTTDAPFTTFAEIERALGDGAFAFIVRVAFSQGEYTDTGLAIGTRYRYRIRMV